MTDISKILVSAFIVFLLAAGADSQDQSNIIAKVKTKSGKEYSFIKDKNKYSFWIRERHNSRRGYMIGSKVQSFSMFNIDINTGDFIKTLSVKDVKKIKFIKVAKGVFKIDITTKNNQVWKLSLKGEYLRLDGNDGVSGTEKSFGYITIPFNKIDSMDIFMPGSIPEEFESRYKTRAVTY